LVLLLSSCTSFLIDPLDNNIIPIAKPEPAEVLDLFTPELASIPAPEKKLSVAIYPQSFTDQTGQRLSNSMYASFSTAITQAPNTYLIRALSRAGSDNGGFFDVVERIGLDSLTKERQIIRSTREAFEVDENLSPLQFAGLLIEGAVVGYESNTQSGGQGARYMGIGMSKQYRMDTVTVSLRLVSVSTGVVLLDVLTSKTIYSASISQDVFRFRAKGTKLVEIEGGNVRNESTNLALQMAIETAVIDLIEQGEEKGFWSYKQL
tara:strand:- start:378 stop:1166 length:789 start_codon:yes stop_codon:yes gene_type:complete